MFFMFSYSQYNLITNYTIEDGTGFEVDADGTLAFDPIVDNTSNGGGSLKFTNVNAGGADNFKATQIGSTEMTKSGAGLYLLKFYVRGPENARVKAAIADGDGAFNWAEFSTNLANSDSNITRIKTADTWQEVSSYMTLVEDWATVKLYNTSTNTGTEIYYDDISLTKVNSPKELVNNNSFNSDVSGSGWVLGNTSFVGEYTTTVDHTNLIGSGSFRLDSDTVGSTSDHIKFSATSPSNFGGAGTYVLTFWVYSTQGEWIKAQVSHSDAGGNPYSTLCQFTESLVNNNPETTRVAQNNTWQKVTSTFTMPDSGYATVKLYSTKTTTSYATYFDDITLKRVVDAENAQTDFSGWEVENASSSLDETTGIHTLNMDDGSPTLTNFDSYIDSSTAQYITVELKNNSENDALSLIYPKWDGSGNTFVTIDIDPMSTNNNYKEYTFDMSNVSYKGNIENLSVRVRKKNDGGGYETTLPTINQSGNVDFKTITYSDTFSIVDYDKNSFTIFPSPVDEVLFIDSEFQLESEIYNMSGQKMLDSSSNTINVSKLSKGVYLLKRGKNTKKFIKK